MLVALTPFLVRQFLLGGTSPKGLKRVKAAWKSAAEDLGFETGVLTERIKGVRRGRQVEVHLVKVDRQTGHDDLQRYDLLTRVQVSLSHERWNNGVKLEPRDTLARIERSAVGDVADLEEGPDIPTGDWNFDNDFIVAGQVGDDVLSRLRRPAVKDALYEIRDTTKWFQIRLGELVTEEDRGIDNEHELVRFVDRVIDAADALDDAMAGTTVDNDDVEDLFPDLGPETE